MLDQPIVVVVVVSLDLICLMLASVHFIEGGGFGVAALRNVLQAVMQSIPEIMC